MEKTEKTKRWWGAPSLSWPLHASQAGCTFFFFSNSGFEDFRRPRWCQTRSNCQGCAITGICKDGVKRPRRLRLGKAKVVFFSLQFVPWVLYFVKVVQFCQEVLLFQEVLSESDLRPAHSPTGSRSCTQMPGCSGFSKLENKYLHFILENQLRHFSFDFIFVFFQTEETTCFFGSTSGLLHFLCFCTLMQALCLESFWRVGSRCFGRLWPLKTFF